MSARKLKKLISSVIGLVLLLSLAWQGITRLVPNSTPENSIPATGSGTLTAEFLDVDQADCELVYLPDGKVLLIDAGNRGDGDEIVAYLKGKGITKIDYLIATHPHADHIGGMAEVINAFEIGKVYAPKIPSSQAPTSQTYKDFLLAVQNKGLKISGAVPSSEPVFYGDGWKAYFFSPVGQSYDELNNYSITLKLTYGIHSFLFTGDAENLSETEMLNAGYNLDCDVLKVGHHGSESSSSYNFLKAASPRYAVISCGSDNSYGHPHDETITALNSLNGLEKTVRTDLDQTVIFTADGKTESGLKFTTKNPTVVE